MDTSAILWDIETGAQVASLLGHTHEVIALQFSQGANTSVLNQTDGDNKGFDAMCGTEGGKLMLTGSFDYTVSLWDVRTGERCTHFIGHNAEVSAACFSYDSNYVASASMDKTVRVWDVRMGRQLQSITGHTDEVLDVVFDASGRQLASASGDGTGRVWYLDSGSNANLDISKEPSSQPGHFKLQCKLIGHESEVSKVCFNSRGNLVLTASADKTARIWDAATGEVNDVLLGHSDEIFSCAFNYEGDMIITGSKDNTCRIWS